MSHRDRGSNFTIVAGFCLLALGVLLLVGQFFGPLFSVFWSLFWFVARLAWPLILIGIGVLLIMRARGAGWNTEGRKYYRSRTDRMLAGVLGGFAHYIGVDATIVRVAYVALSLLTGGLTGIILYVIAMLIVPEEPYGQGYMPPPAPSVPGPAPYAPTPPPASAVPAPPAPPVTPPAVDPATAPSEAPPVPPTPPVL